MAHTQLGLRFEVVWSDNDLFAVRATASNGKFAGTAGLYVPIGGLAEAAEHISGFPRIPSDSCELQFGKFGPTFGGGAINARFFCVGRAGRSFVEIKLESDFQCGAAENVQLTIPIEASAVDTFVEELRSLEANREGSAQLLARLPT